MVTSVFYFLPNGRYILKALHHAPELESTELSFSVQMYKCYCTVQPKDLPTLIELGRQRPYLKHGAYEQPGYSCWSWRHPVFIDVDRLNMIKLAGRPALRDSKAFLDLSATSAAPMHLVPAELVPREPGASSSAQEGRCQPPGGGEERDEESWLLDHLMEDFAASW